MREQPAQPTAGARDHHALAGHVGGAGEGRRGSRSAPPSTFPVRRIDSRGRGSLYRSVQYMVRVQPTPTSSRCTGGCSLIRGFEERVAALYRDGEVPGFVHLSIGQEASRRRRVLAARPGRRDHVDPSRPRPLPREGTRPARDVRRADGEGRGHEPRARRLDAHRRSGARHLRRQRHRRAPGCRSRSGAATAARLRRDGTVAVAFFGDGAVAHGTFHEAVNLAAVWRLPVDLLLREQRLRGVLAGLGAARGAARTPRGRLRRRLRRGRRQRRGRDRDRDAGGGRGDAGRATVR